MQQGHRSAHGATGAQCPALASPSSLLGNAALIIKEHMVQQALSVLRWQVTALC